MDDEEETCKLWRIRRTIMKLCFDRGYLVTPEEYNQTLLQFKEQFGDKPSDKRPSRSDLQVLVSRIEDPSDQMYVFFSDEDKPGIAVIKKYCNKMETEGIFKAIIVTKLPLAPASAKGIVNLAPKFSFEHFLEAEVIINITEHELVPKHILLTRQEKQQLLKQYKLKESQLSRILTSDPVARYLGLKRGQVVKIIRSSFGTANQYISYRVAW